MDISKIRPTRGRVFLEALFPVDTESGLILPPEYYERYPEIGRVLAIGQLSENIQVGDVCLVPDEGSFQGRTYWQVCYLVLKDWPERILCDVSVEPVVREVFEEFRANPSTALKQILVETIDKDKVSFDSSDILEVGLEDLSNPGVKLDYVPVEMLRAWHDGRERLFYFVLESQIPLALRTT